MTGVQTCALPILFLHARHAASPSFLASRENAKKRRTREKYKWIDVHDTSDSVDLRALRKEVQKERLSKSVQRMKKGHPHFPFLADGQLYVLPDHQIYRLVSIKSLLGPNSHTKGFRLLEADCVETELPFEEPRSSTDQRRRRSQWRIRGRVHTAMP